MSLDDRTRTWQLIMTGHALRHVTPNAQADMARLLDLDPSISHLTLEIGDVSVHVARDWPSDQHEAADRLTDRIAAYPSECIDCGVCEPECPAEAILPVTESGLEQWLELTTTFSAQWPNVTRKLDQTPPDADAMKGVENKYEQFFSPEPGKGD